MQVDGGLDRALRVVGDPGRDFERDPAVDTIRPLRGRPEEIGGPLKVLDREVEEDLLLAQTLAGGVGDGVVVGVRRQEGLVEDGRVRRQAGDAELVDVCLQRPAREQVARDVVEPEALPVVVQFLRWLHLSLLVTRLRGIGSGRGRPRRPSLA